MLGSHLASEVQELLGVIVSGLRVFQTFTDDLGPGSLIVVPVALLLATLLQVLQLRLHSLLQVRKALEVVLFDLHLTLQACVPGEARAFIAVLRVHRLEQPLACLLQRRLYLVTPCTGCMPFPGGVFRGFLGQRASKLFLLADHDLYALIEGVPGLRAGSHVLQPYVGGVDLLLQLIVLHAADLFVDGRDVGGDDVGGLAGHERLERFDCSGVLLYGAAGYTVYGLVCIHDLEVVRVLCLIGRAADLLRQLGPVLLAGQFRFLAESYGSTCRTAYESACTGAFQIVFPVRVTLEQCRKGSTCNAAAEGTYSCTLPHLVASGSGVGLRRCRFRLLGLALLFGRGSGLVFFIFLSGNRRFLLFRRFRRNLLGCGGFVLSIVQHHAGRGRRGSAYSGSRGFTLLGFHKVLEFPHRALAR